MSVSDRICRRPRYPIAGVDPAVTAPAARRGARRAFSAVEILISSAVLAAAILPIYSLVRSNQQVAYLSEYRVVARRLATRALNQVAYHPYPRVVAAAGGAAPARAASGLTPGMKRVALSWTPAAAEVGLMKIPGKILESYVARADQMEVTVYFEELALGFGTLAALVEWKDPSSKAARSLVETRFIQDPLHFEVLP